MIGIQLHKDRASVAIWKKTGPEVIGTGKGVADLAAMAITHSGVDPEIGVIAVPAWYNDEQRADILAQARKAGIVTPRLMNEPAAAALAFGLSKAAMPEISLVLDLLPDGTFDVTLLFLGESFVEVLAANGLKGLSPAVISDPGQLFAKIEPVINRAFKDAELDPKSIDAIILTGKTAPLRAAETLIESVFGRAPEVPPLPDNAIARGAAFYSKMSARLLDSKDTEKPSPPRTGCLSVLVLAIVLFISLAR